jgi:hypothetical protein
MIYYLFSIFVQAHDWPVNRNCRFQGTLRNLQKKRETLSAQRAAGFIPAGSVSMPKSTGMNEGPCWSSILTLSLVGTKNRAITVGKDFGREQL